MSKPFEFPVESNTDKNPMRQMQKVTVLRDMAHLTNAIHELQARVQSLEDVLQDETIQEETEKDA